MIADNVKRVCERIQAAKSRAGRSDEVSLVAVSKGKPAVDIDQAYEAGVRVVGENRVQEFLEKIEAVTQPVSWHLVGHLQRNKVKYVVGKVELIHSVDSVRLAQQISTVAVRRDEQVDVLLQVNVAGEESKYGFGPESVMEVAGDICALAGVNVRGLMTIPPYDPDAERSRPYFDKLRQVRDQLEQRYEIDLLQLSMGMTEDYEVAIEEGATIVRVGRAIFGERMS